MQVAREVNDTNNESIGLVSDIIGLIGNEWRCIGAAVVSVYLTVLRYAMISLISLSERISLPDGMVPGNPSTISALG